MRINWLEIKKGNSYKLKKVYFNNLNLLVGKTGAGKTEILNTIKTLGYILAKTKTSADFENYIYRNFIGFKCILSFSIKNDNYIYKIKFDDNNGRYGISNEELFENENAIFIRTKTNLFVTGYENIPKVSENYSLINIFKEDIYSKIKTEFSKIVSFDNNLIQKKDFLNRDELKFFENIKFSKLPLLNLSYKSILAIIHKYFKKEFDYIEQMFINVFQNVSKITFEYNDYNEYTMIIYHNDNSKINQLDLSSGMSKTLHMLVLIKILPSESVLLMDEVENSLGINCLNVVLEELMFLENIQCIFSSHHPYVINSIKPKDWKVVSRKDFEIVVRSAEEIGIGTTLHDTFYELINSLNFEEDF